MDFPELVPASWPLWRESPTCTGPLRQAFEHLAIFAAIEVVKPLFDAPERNVVVIVVDDWQPTASLTPERACQTGKHE